MHMREIHSLFYLSLSLHLFPNVNFYAKVLHVASKNSLKER